MNTYVNAADWNKRAKLEMQKVTIIDPERGNILADNGNILACNLQAYDIKFDAAHEKIKKLGKISWKQVDSLADSLDRYYPMVADLDKLSERERAEHSWHKRLKTQLERPESARNRAIFIKKKGSPDDFERIRNFPFFNQFTGKGTKNPVYFTVRDVRIYPFGTMAQLSVGRTNIDSATGKIHGYAGLERDLDSLLYGKPGQARKVPLTSGLGNWTMVKPIRGYDVHTTINIDMQDMLEEELKRICIENGAAWGTAILMEVKTGDIKAISNVEELEDGSYGEALNRAVLAYEPGSVMKPISLMVAFEDGLVKSVNDVIDCSPFQGTSDPHAPTVKNMKQVIEMSSNTGIARVLFRKYAKDPEGFRNRLAEMGFFDKFHTGIHEERIPYIPKLSPRDSKGNNITMTARLLSLARQTYGYNTMLPPLYTLAMYNAIANDGKFVRPRLIQGLINEQGKDSIIPVSYIRQQVCSPETAKKVRECMREVVIGKHGTGRMLDDDRVAVAGKTGTAFPVLRGAYDKSRRRLAFAGFFPYENPKYSCMVLIEAPAGRGAARTSGQVLLNMALRLYSRGWLDNKATFTHEKLPSETPAMASSTSANYANVRDALKLPEAKRISTAKGVAAGQVPDVRGYDARSAIRILEQRGINVRISGAGRVVSQSIEPGSPLKRGESITLTLRI